MPVGEPIIKVVAMPKDTNPDGDIFGGWLFSQMDLAALTYAHQLSKGKAATVAVNSLKFLKPVNVGDLVTCYVQHTKTGRSSMTFDIEAWTNCHIPDEAMKVTSSTFIFVAIDKNNKPRFIDKRLMPQRTLAHLELDETSATEATLNTTSTYNYYFLSSALLSLSLSLAACLIGSIAMIGLISLTPAISAPLLGLGLAGIGFFCHAFIEKSVSETPNLQL